ncbi:hypothetical protein LZ198_10905 [Myxococcus sp. K15C18031901]|uniref:hypothetical protein n=1 Tax=Myxococcus dinghuensis TaxID=2906761 RepID=UPI0020A7002D|nr:hypothetical protein [Myxococcus dinghuensis]MCP3099378.1 hypothetical protein [Myxococcus dinghuensis]
MLALSACRREPPPPSAEYEQASRQFRTLYAQKLDEAYLDPQMGEIEAQLQRVPQASLDAPAAQELLQRIARERARMQGEVDARHKAVASAREVPPTASSPSALPVALPPPPVEVAPADAGAPDAGPIPGPQMGTPASELVAGFRGCFQRGAPINVEGRGLRETWELNPRTSCTLEYPTHVDSVLLIEEGRVLMVLPKSSVRTVPRTLDGGTAPDAGR